MTYKLPLVVRCVKEFKSTMYPDLDFGVLGKEYDVDLGINGVFGDPATIVQDGVYYVLRDPLGGALMGELGTPNHLVNVDRFEVVSWLTPFGIE